MIAIAGKPGSCRSHPRSPVGAKLARDGVLTTAIVGKPGFYSPGAS
ncbi:hypothetical protein C4K35_2456 [Pseudomonas chlororaphis subsp. piscium]|nr:hypothetical protein C4K35_2456 [Pseudomonas chlororaphis subsp. piscium]AZC56618.1 hypothetical protein C4K34_2453 [Pseudomonas chlororaphis subsp. piscium]AZC75254.1 hypothetical protein C4K31_2351 [Pseudomonas chlororaphis subsp. piscium]AZC88724.1 hypothetical protein C4K29_2423 [Pseudomonas chlororaphis subsp. piscium]